MKRNIIIVLIILFVLFFVILSISLIDKKSNNGSKSEEINIVLGSEPNSLDPALSLTIDVRSYMSNMFEGLLNIDKNGNISPGVAFNWESNENNTEYIFYLRKDAKWSDGTDITANDFKYEWLRVLDPNTASGWASYLYYIKGAEGYNNGNIGKDEVGIYVLDNYTLKVVLENPCSFFASITALQPYYPVKESVITEYGDSWTQTSDSYITNGAFKLDSWDHDNKISLIKNENYWNKDVVKTSNINFILYSDSSTILNAYEADELDYVESMLTSLEMQQVAKLNYSNFVYTKFLAFNLNSKVFENINVRKAISLALDREEIANIMGIEMEPLMSFIPYGFFNSSENKDYTQDSNSKRYLEKNSNIGEAKKLLEEAGYKDGNGLGKITYLTNTSSSNIALAEIVKSQLSKIGINVEIQALESKVFNDYRKEKKFDIVAASWAAEYPDITSYLYGFRSKDLNNYSSFSSIEFDNIYNNILSEIDINKKFKLVHEAEDLVMNSYCIAPLYSEKTCFIVKDEIKGFYHDITGCINFVQSYKE